MRLLFSFGAIMHVPTVKRIAPRAEPLGPGRAEGWRFRIMRHGFATLVPEPGAAVHGLVWRIGPVEEAILDDYEDVGHGLYAKRRISIVRDARTERALVYLSPSIEPGRPQPGYMERRVLPAARALGFPEDYLRELEGWAARAGPVTSPYTFD